MLRFECDYAEGAHPQIMERLMATNFEQTPGYGVDTHCEHARALVRDFCAAPDAQVHLMVGGTPCNLTLIAAALRPHQGALAAQTGHIAVHESGAIEATGHKVLTVPSDDGKITAAQVDAYCADHFAQGNREHTVQPKLVYISQPTENGTVYKKDELVALRAACDKWGLFLYVDGARLSYALASEGNDVTAADLGALCDAFYIGGTKVGALFGEAMVINHPALQEDFRYILKQHGGMLAKGRLLGVQFETLLENGLYTDIGVHAVGLALRIRDAFAVKGYTFRYASPTNQQFPILPYAAIEKLKEQFSFEFWEKYDETSAVVRFCTSWATKSEDVDKLITAIENL
ncbi:MAG: aminotransferase class V-fold PLP-dependent enzyme [Ruminococcaceae bacterium]|nr:aminotransferase class V-fold PLP-dependent enzyme [Oscillospiraceae bacterium]